MRSLVDIVWPNRPQPRTVLVGRELRRNRIQTAVMSETRFAEVGKSKEKKLVPDTLSSAKPYAKAKRGVKQELTLPFKQNINTHSGLPKDINDYIETSSVRQYKCNRCQCLCTYYQST